MKVIIYMEGSIMKKMIASAAILATVITVFSGCAPAPTPPPTATVSPTAIATVPAGDSQRTLTVDGMERSYLLHVPAGLAADQPLPLVLIFHGYSNVGGTMARTTGFNGLADAYGFFAAYPNGTGPDGGTSWNAGGCCGFAQYNNVDETAFVRAIIADLKKEAPIDPSRVYATGFSNGAFLAYRLGCEMSDTFAAVAPVAGVLLTNPCNPSRPVSILHIHGMADPSVPYAGSATPNANGVYESVQQSIATWAQLDGCSSTPAVELTSLAKHTVYAGCKNGTAVELYSLSGIGHTWPPDTILPASRIIWNFFVAHPKA
jgi:polyhydroxybutyrate depolymerase